MEYDEFMKWINDSDDSSILAIVDHRLRNDRIEYLVRWNIKDKADSWEDSSNISCYNKILMMWEGKNNIIRGDEKKNTQNHKNQNTNIQNNQLTPKKIEILGMEKIKGELMFKVRYLPQMETKVEKQSVIKSSFPLEYINYIEKTLEKESNVK